MRDGLQQPGAAERLFNKLYVTDVQRLLARETMWKTRAPPTPLDWDAAHQQFPDKAPTAQGEKSSLKDHQSLGLKQTVDLFESRYVACPIFTKLLAQIPTPPCFR